MTPRIRGLALLAARVACVTAPLLFLGLLATGVAHFAFEAGNYPEPKHRHTAGALFLFVFAPTTLAIAFFARRRLRELKAFQDSDGRSDTKAGREKSGT